MTVTKTIDSALSHLKAGEIAQAEALCQQILADDPTRPEALHCMGLIAIQSGNYKSAALYLERVLAFEKDPPALLYCQLAYVLQNLGRDREALAYYDEALRLDPAIADIYGNRGFILNRNGARQESIESYKRAIELAPHKPEFYYNLGNVCKDTGQLIQAAENYKKAIALIDKDPQSGPPTLYANLYNNLGRLFADAYDYEKAIICLKKSLASDPTLWNAYYNYANTMRQKGDMQEAIAYYRKALELNPTSPAIHWGYAMAHLPVFFDKAEDIDLSRVAFINELDRLARWFDIQREFKEGGAVGDALAFSLAYQERNNRDLMTKYGKLCARVMEGWFAQQIISPHGPSLHRHGKTRVGIVSSHFRDHSVWRALIKGWLQNFDPSQIDIHIFHCGFHADAETDWAKEKATSFSAVGEDLGTAVRVVVSKQCDVLIYPDIGMDTLILKLASLRLSRVQAVSWGHPETTGLPTIDYYLSAEDFEPADADKAYSERLIRLPRLGCCYEPLKVTSERQDLKALGIRPDVPLLLSPGLSIKYAPQHDHVFVEIARRLGDCQIVFFAGPDALAGKLEARIKKAFERENMDFSSYCVFIPWQTQAAFYGLLEQAVLFLDTIGFSGFNTAIQAVQCGVPIVTREGQFMRGRFASAILKRLELGELVQHSDEDYIAHAVKLVQDSDYRNKIRTQIQEKRDSLWGDKESVFALQKFLSDAANGVH